MTTLTKNIIDVNGLCTTFQRRNVSLMYCNWVFTLNIMYVQFLVYSERLCSNRQYLHLTYNNNRSQRLCIYRLEKSEPSFWMTWIACACLRASVCFQWKACTDGTVYIMLLTQFTKQICMNNLEQNDTHITYILRCYRKRFPIPCFFFFFLHFFKLEFNSMWFN